MDRPLSILHVLWKGDIGGAERAVYMLIREQLHDPMLKPAILFAQSGGLYQESIQQIGCQVITLDIPRAYAIENLPKIVAAMKPFDIHHFHIAEPVLKLASLACVGVTRIYTHRGGLMDYPFKKRVRYRLVGILLRHFFHGFSGNTAHGACCGAKLYRRPPESFQVTYNGFDPDLLMPTRTPEEVRLDIGLEATQYVIGTTANLKPWKRIERLLEAVHALANPRLKLLIVGDGIDRPRLEAITQQFDIQSQVIFVGKQPCVADYLQVMDAFCLPSMGLESFGNAAVEAMAMQLPTIVFSDGGGLVEHIQPDQTGFMVNNQLELNSLINRLMENPELGRQIGIKARSVVLEKYAPSRSAAAYKELYQTAIAKRSERKWRN